MDVLLETIFHEPQVLAVEVFAQLHNEEELIIIKTNFMQTKILIVVFLIISNICISQNYALRFFGNGEGDIDRVKIPIDNPEKPIDVGLSFTIEFQLKAQLVDNPLGTSATEGNNDDWVLGHVIIDRDIFGNGDYGDYGISLANGRIAFGVNKGTNSYTIIGNINVADDNWHHIAITRNHLSGNLQIFVDGILDKSVNTNVIGDISYRNNRPTTWDNDPYIVLGAEKHDYDNSNYPSYSGLLDELRFSNIVRYTSNYSPVIRFQDDVNTVGLFHFDEGAGIIAGDSALISGNFSNGTISVGGNPSGPLWILNNIEGNIPLNPWSPPEFFPSKAVLIEWDFNLDTWTLYSELISEIITEAEVVIVVENLTQENVFRNYLQDDNVEMDNISFVHIPSGRMWTRDHGPLSVMTDNGVAFMDFEDFANSNLSSALPTNLANLWGIDVYNHGNVIFDGGNFMVDSYNNLFATNRLYTNNPSHSSQQINQLLETYMGINNIVTFEQMGTSDVWGHIDMQMKLLDDSTVVISSVQAGWAIYDILEANYLQFASLTTPFGTPYRIRRLPKAENWKTYTNSLIVNNKVIIPQYNHPNDIIAINTYQELMPNHEIVGINANSIVGWDGVIHCITMQLFDETQIGQPETFTIHVMVNPQNSGHVAGAGPYPENDIVTLTATAETGYIFENWTELGNIIDNTETLTFYATQNRTLTANFSLASNLSHIQNNKIQISPNPANNYIRILADKEHYIEIFDIMGQVLIVSKEKVIDISSLNPGLYFLRIENELFKVIKN
jgi:agmatine/peptidylarginine deiminase